MSGVKIPIEPEFESGGIDQALQKLQQQLNKLGQAVAQANKIKFNPVDRTTLDDLRKMQAQLSSLQKIAPDLNKRLRATQQESADFFSLDWQRLYPDPNARARQMRKVYEYVTAGTGATLGSKPQFGGGAVSPGASFGGIGRQVVGAGLNAAGPVGGVANSALSAGLSGGAMAGIAGLVGGLAALGVGKLVSGIAGKIGAVQNEAIGYDTLKRALGDVNVGFDALRESLRKSSDAMDVTYEQSLKMGTEFAKIAGVSGDAYKTIANEVAVGGGFGRAFGMAPEQASAFFAQMRQFQVTGNEADSRRLALLIGESISKSGAFAKADEVLQAIGGYTAQQTRMGLVSANAGAFGAALSGMVGSGVPGLDVTGSANLLNRLNMSIAGGGAAGEAGQNYLYRVLGHRLGLDPIQAQLLMSQGAFGTGAETFGQGSLYSQFASKFGGGAPAAALGSTQTNLQMIMTDLQRQYAGNPSLMVDAMSRLFGLSVPQSMALATIGPANIGNLQKSLATSNVDIMKMSPTAISALAQIQSGGRDVLTSQSRALWSKLNAGEASELDKAAAGGDTEALRSTLIKLTAKYGQAETEGSQTRKTIQDLDKDMMDAATKMIGPLNTMRDTLLYAFGNRGSMTAADMHKAVVDAQKQHVNAQADARISKARARYELLAAAGGLGGAMTADQMSELSKAYDNMQSETAAANKDRAAGLAQIDADNSASPLGGASQSGNSLPLPASLSGGASGNASPGAGGGGGDFVAKYKPLADAISQKTGISSRVILAQIAVETGWGKHELPGSFNPFNIQAFGWSGRTVTATDHDARGNPYSAKFRAYGSYGEAADDFASLLMRRYKGALNTGNDVGAFTAGMGGYAQDPNYGAKIENAYSMLGGTPMPDGASSALGGSATQRIAIEGTFHLNGSNGQPAAAPMTITKSVLPPNPYHAASR